MHVHPWDWASAWAHPYIRPSNSAVQPSQAVCTPSEYALSTSFPKACINYSYFSFMASSNARRWMHLQMLLILAHADMLCSTASSHPESPRQQMNTQTAQQRTSQPQSQKHPEHSSTRKFRGQTKGQSTVPVYGIWIHVLPVLSQYTIPAPVDP